MNFLEILKYLSQNVVEFIIVGGVAARLYGSTRLTHDLDIVPKMDEDSWKHLIEMMWKLGVKPRIPESRERIENLENIQTWIVEKNMLALSFRNSSGQVEIDVLVSEANNFESLKSSATTIPVGDCVYYVASLDDLITMKRKAGRSQDLWDIEILERIKQQQDD